MRINGLEKNRVTLRDLQSFALVIATTENSPPRHSLGLFPLGVGNVSVCLESRFGEGLVVLHGRYDETLI